MLCLRHARQKILITSNYNIVTRPKKISSRDYDMHMCPGVKDLIGYRKEIGALSKLNFDKNHSNDTFQIG